MHTGWQKNPRVTLRIKKLFVNIIRNPFRGIGKSEPLKGRTEEWSRRIDDSNRIIYRVDKDCVIFLRCRGHYDGH
ncbi:MAG: Txe/YoeB family addiction module toxin [Puniceicoccales bacterium]|jgi:toxin YoeB|nr:Txe/YoeB family addiction module toxin [Puniceicoccales bacterium]